VAKHHPNKEISAAIDDAISLGWSFVKRNGKGHAYGLLRCPHGSGGCQKSVFSTPKNPGNHTREIRAAVNRCPH
jgi:hypothetical protein